MDRSRMKVQNAIIDANERFLNLLSVGISVATRDGHWNVNGDYAAAGHPIQR
jgi:hypothetical protein